MDTKQTAVEWMFKQLWETPKDKLDWYAILKQAKAMEKEQIVEAWCDGAQPDKQNTIFAQQYYNETYGRD